MLSVAAGGEGEQPSHPTIDACAQSREHLAEQSSNDEQGELKVFLDSKDCWRAGSDVDSDSSECEHSKSGDHAFEAASVESEDAIETIASGLKQLAEHFCQAATSSSSRGDGAASVADARSVGRLEQLVYGVQQSFELHESSWVVKNARLR